MTFQTNFPLYPAKLPFVTVSSKGMSNGLSDIPNDGADFGPDTLLRTSSKGQYGPPYTQTSGIQEAWNYAFANAVEYTNYGTGNYWMKPILLLDGVFTVNQKVFLSPSVRIFNPKMIGSGSMSTYVMWNFNDNCIEIDHTNGNIRYSNIEISSMQPVGGANVGPGTAFFAANYVSGDPAYQANVFQSYDMDFSNTFNGNAMFSLTGFQNIILYNIEAYDGGTYGGLYSENTNTVQILGSIMHGHYASFYLNNVNSLVMYGTETGGSGGVLSNVNFVHIDYYEAYSSLIINGNVGYIHIENIFSPTPYPFLTNQTNTPVTIDKLKIDRLNVIANTFTFTNSSYITVNDISIDTINIASGASINIPILSTVSGTTAGTVNLRFRDYSTSYKKLVITFSGYENDTTTNQTISYPLPFSTTAVITANNTGLTISTSTTGITITSPNSTTTYSGIVIVEGY